MATDYTKKKNAELEALLKARSLPHNGKKADLIARLQAYDVKQAASVVTPEGKPATTVAAEDDIDWDDDAPATQTNTAAAHSTSNPAHAAALAAGGIGPVANPVVVPNQIVDPESDPSKTHDLTVHPPEDSGSLAPDTVSTADVAKQGFASHLPTSDVTAELEKRTKRAERFGIKSTPAVINDNEKALERAKRFGTVNTEVVEAVGGLDKALPERQARERKGGAKEGAKRERGEDEGQGQGRSKRVDSRRREEEKKDGEGGARAGTLGSAVRGQGGTKGRKTDGKTATAGVGAKKGAVSEKDRLAAEARKTRFGGGRQGGEKTTTATAAAS